MKSRTKYLFIQVDETFTYDTLQLIQAFGIPTGHHLVVDKIIATTTTANTQFEIHWDMPFVDKEHPALVPDIGRPNTMALFIAVALDAKEFSDLDIQIFDSLEFEEITSTTMIYTIKYHTETGPMRITDDLAKQLADYRVIGERETSPGEAFDKTGDYKRLGVEN